MTICYEFLMTIIWIYTYKYIVIYIYIYVCVYKLINNKTNVITNILIVQYFDYLHIIIFRQIMKLN